MAENVRAALVLVARGEAPLGIVYETDAKIEPAVKIVGVFPADSHPPIVYPVALTKGAKPDAAQYLAFLRTPEAKAIFERYGFNVLVKPDGLESRLPCFDLSPAEWTAVELSLRISIVATAVALPFGIAIGWVLARKEFWGKTLLDGIVYLPLVLPPVVTGYLLLISFGRRGLIGAFLADYFGIVFSFRWTGAALSCGIMGFPLMVRPIRLALEAIDRRLEDAGATLGAESGAGIPDDYLAAGVARHHRRRGDVLCAGARRIRRHYHVRLQYSGRNADHLGRDLLRLLQVPDGEAAAGRLGHYRYRDRARRADCLRMVRPPRRHALSGGMIVLDVDVEKKLGTFAVAARFQASAGVTALFGPSGSGKTTIVNMIAGLA